MTAPQDHPYGFSPSAASAEFDDQFDPLQFDDDEYALDGDEADDCFGALGGSFTTSASASSVASSQAGGGGVGKKARANNRKGPHNADKRATHNAVERKRRESLNTRFLDLAKALPTMQHIKRPSKAVIVTKALDYVYDSLLRERALVEENNQLRVEVDALRAKLGLPSLPPPKPLPECRPATQSTLRRSKKVLMAGSARKEEPVPVAVKQEPAPTSASGSLPTPPTASPSIPPIPSPASYAPALSASPSAASIPFDSTQQQHQAPTFPPSLFANTAVPTSAADLTSPLDAAATAAASLYAATGHSIHSPVSAPAVMNQSNPFFVGPAHPPAPPPALHGLYAPHGQAQQMMPPQYQLFFALQQQQQQQAQAQAQSWNIHQQQFAAWGAGGQGADSPTNTSVSSSSPASSTMFASAVPASFAVDGLAF
ncbi:hypothetical protein JCM10296v2_002556 [Rhodotorula toruloides]